MRQTKKCIMKIIRIGITMFVLILCCVMFTACGGKKTENILTGKWETDEHGGETLIFNDDGTYMYTAMNGNDASGSYKIMDNEIQMTSDASGLGADLNKVSGLHEFTVNGNILSFDRLGFGATEFTKAK